MAQEDFAQIKLHFVDPIQHDYEVIYEVIRPLVLFSETAAARSLETGVERTVVGDKTKRFIIEGMLGLADKRPGAAGRKGHVYPDAVAASRPHRHFADSLCRPVAIWMPSSHRVGQWQCVSGGGLCDHSARLEDRTPPY